MSESPKAKKEKKEKKPKKQQSVKTRTIVSITVFVLVIILAAAMDYAMKKPDIYKDAKLPHEKKIVEIDFKYEGKTYKLEDKEDIHTFMGILKEMYLAKDKKHPDAKLKGKTYEFDLKTETETHPMVFNEDGSCVKIDGVFYDVRGSGISRLYDVFVKAYK